MLFLKIFLNNLYGQSLYCPFPTENFQIYRFLLTVPPAFKTRPLPVLMIPPGANASFDCSASGIPKPNITWPPLWSPWPEKRVTTTKNGVRTIFNMQLSDAGRYRCVVVSTAGFTSRDFLLYMKGAEILFQSFVCIIFMLY